MIDWEDVQFYGENGFVEDRKSMMPKTPVLNPNFLVTHGKVTTSRYLTSWSDWTKCPAACADSRNSVKTRSRDYYGDICFGDDCEVLMQVTSCRNNTLESYTSEVNTFGSNTFKSNTFESNKFESDTLENEIPGSASSETQTTPSCKPTFFDSCGVTKKVSVIDQTTCLFGSIKMISSRRGGKEVFKPKKGGQHVCVVKYVNYYEIYMNGKLVFKSVGTTDWPLQVISRKFGGQFSNVMVYNVGHEQAVNLSETSSFSTPNYIQENIKMFYELNCNPPKFFDSSLQTSIWGKWTICTGSCNSMNGTKSRISLSGEVENKMCAPLPCGIIDRGSFGAGIGLLGLLVFWCAGRCWSPAIPAKKPAKV